MAEGTFAELDLASIRRFERTIRRMPDDIREDVLFEAGSALVGEAQVNAPVKTGNLKDAHDGEMDGDVMVIGVNTDYAMAVHETHPSRARWFIKAIRRNFRRVFGKSIRKHLRERGSK